MLIPERDYEDDALLLFINERIPISKSFEITSEMAINFSNAPTLRNGHYAYGIKPKACPGGPTDTTLYGDGARNLILKAEHIRGENGLNTGIKLLNMSSSTFREVNKKRWILTIYNDRSLKKCLTIGSS